MEVEPDWSRTGGTYQHQIVRLTLEEGWTRQRACDYLHISLKTLIRDQAEALDALIQL